MMDKDKLDAGLRSHDHYKSRLPAWRYRLRQRLLPLVRWETPYVAWLQEKMRLSALDSYFAFTANLGTHTFFMIILPILFWCGYTNLGRAVTQVLASGVFFSGFVKDLVCLPRPLSPPLQRITMSGSAALEYGFPSTHSTNAVSVATYALLSLNSPNTSVTGQTNLLIQILFSWYAFSIVLGRVYCGMHGFFDVVVGSLLGALLGAIQCLYGDAFDDFLYSESPRNMFIILLVTIVLVRVHPEPADDCPCFDDSVAFAGVVVGITFGNWHFSQTSFSISDPHPSTTPFNLQTIGWVRAIARIMLGILTIFAWREIMKPSLLRLLPPLFRVIERLGLSLPRKFFTRASEYTMVPKHLKDDNIIPSMSELPAIITSIRHPRRRAISVGPQSEADAYETLAYREKRRRESISPSNVVSPVSLRQSVVKEDGSTNVAMISEKLTDPSSSPPRSPVRSKIDEFEHMMGTGSTSAVLPPGVNGENVNQLSRVASEQKPLQEPGEKEMFEKLQKPRVRYDVEVVTKLIVYSGIAWLGVEGNPILFELVGLGMGRRG